MLEVALFTIKNKSLVIFGVLFLVLVGLLIISPRQPSLSPLYWSCVTLFLVVGVLRMVESLIHWGVKLDAAFVFVIGNLLFMAGCVFFLHGPKIFSALNSVRNNVRNNVRGIEKKQISDESGALKKIRFRWRLTNSPLIQRTTPESNLEDSGAETQPQLAEKLTDFMEQQKPYLEPHITVERLAAKLNVSPKSLSGTINNELHVNFFELISSYRVEEAKKRLADAEMREIPISEIMKSCGFNSKSVFNQAFKKTVGVTPSNYRQQLTSNN